MRTALCIVPHLIFKNQSGSWMESHFMGNQIEAKKNCVTCPSPHGCKGQNCLSPDRTGLSQFRVWTPNTMRYSSVKCNLYSLPQEGSPVFAESPVQNRPSIHLCWSGEWMNTQHRVNADSGKNHRLVYACQKLRKPWHSLMLSKCVLRNYPGIQDTEELSELQ